MRQALFPLRRKVRYDPSVHLAVNTACWSRINGDQNVLSNLLGRRNLDQAHLCGRRDVRVCIDKSQDWLMRAR